MGAGKRSPVGLLPRSILPELVEIGDDIEVRFAPDNGVTVTQRGTVGKILATGATRHFLTAEGRTIMAHGMTRSRGLAITLHARKPIDQVALFDAM